MPDINEKKASEVCCPNCGSFVDEAVRYCNFCGYDLSGEKDYTKKESVCLLRIFSYIVMTLSVLAIGIALYKLLG